MNPRTEEQDTAQDKPSRTQKKKAALGMQKTGERLLTLNDTQLKTLQLPIELHEAVVAARKMKSHGARRRQMQYIGGLMRQVDAAQLQQDLDRMAFHAHDETRRFKQVEQWRDELAAGDQDRLAWLLTRFPAIDEKHLVRLVEDARGKTAAADRRIAGRALFRYLRQFIERPVNPEPEWG